MMQIIEADCETSLSLILDTCCLGWKGCGKVCQQNNKGLWEGLCRQNNSSVSITFNKKRFQRSSNKTACSVNKDSRTNKYKFKPNSPSFQVSKLSHQVFFVFNDRNSNGLPQALFTWLRCLWKFSWAYGSPVDVVLVVWVLYTHKPLITTKLTREANTVWKIGWKVTCEVDMLTFL